MIRHIIKASNAEEIQAAIEAGTLAAPYLAYNSSANTANLVYPQGKEIPEVDYTEESGESAPVTAGTIFRTYRGQYGYLRAQINIPITFAESVYGYPKVYVINKEAYDNAYEQQGGSAEIDESDFIQMIFYPGEGQDRCINNGYIYEARSVYDGDYAFGKEIMWLTEKDLNNSDYIQVPSDGSTGYVVIACQCNYTYDNPEYGAKLGEYTMLPGVTDSPGVVWESIQEGASDQIPGPSNNERGYWARVAPNSIYDSVRYAGYVLGDCSPQEAIEDDYYGNVRDASITAETNWAMTDNNPFTFVYAGGGSTGGFAMQFYNSETGEESGFFGKGYFYLSQ